MYAGRGDFPPRRVLGRFLFSMAYKPLKIRVRLFNERFPRFVIVSNRRCFWTGASWSKSLGKALLYAHARLVQEDAEELGRKHQG
jgi:hypothetical protein